MADSLKLLSDEETADLRGVMATPGGRRAVRRWMAKTGIYRSAMRMRPNVLADERLLFNVAQQDFGRRIQAEVMEADPMNFQLMNSEATARKLMEREKGGKDPDEEADGE